jgi:hypothetical protein
MYQSKVLVLTSRKNVIAEEIEFLENMHIELNR